MNDIGTMQDSHDMRDETCSKRSDVRGEVGRGRSAYQQDCEEDCERPSAWSICKRLISIVRWNVVVCAHRETTVA
jgi:hypothetical protein